jgi:DNA ligase (NAD+)
MKIKAALISALKQSPIATLDSLTADEIANILQAAGDQYFNKGKPILSDNLYDEVKAYLQKRDPKHPILLQVGSIVRSGKVTLPYWMGSMDKIKSNDKDIRKWASRFAGGVILSDKLDGNSALIHMKGKNAPKMFTRGNGHEGQDISHMLAFISGVPRNYASLEDLTVRGELIISRSAFESVKHLGKNARNMVAGILNAKNPDMQIAKLVKFVAYELINPNNLLPSEGLAFLKKTGFEVVHHEIVSLLDLSSDLLSKFLKDRRSKSPYMVDGIVVIHDALDNKRISGENPKHAFAFKSMSLMDHVEVVVQSVEWNVSKDGYIKPVVIFEGVDLGGVVVRRATGNNAKFIHDNMIGPGAKIVVTRSGDVIPAITAIVEHAEAPSMPADIPYKWNDSGCDIVVQEARYREDIAIKQLEFFFSKVKVKGLSAGLLTKLYAAGFDNVDKILSASRADLVRIDGFKDKLASNIVEAIEHTMKSVDVISLMQASNAFGRGIGGSRITLITKAFPKILVDDKYYPETNELIQLEGIERKTAEKFIEGLRSWRDYKKKNRLTRFLSAPPANVVPTPPHQSFKDIVVVFTGFRNKVLEDEISARGGKINQSISKNVDIVIKKDDDATSSKITKAQELGLEIMSLKTFLKKNELKLQS